MTTLYYQKETNYYARQQTPGNFTLYARGGHLAKVDYGQRVNKEDLPAPSQVVFTTQNRCVSLNATCDTLDPMTNSGSYPDVPSDLMCNSQATCFGQNFYTPSFFTSKRLVQADSNVWNPATAAYRGVHRLLFSHEFPNTGEAGVNSKLWLLAIQRVDPALPANAFTPTVFGRSAASLLANRADAAPGLGVPWIYLYRVDQIRNELFGETKVTYFQNRPCTPIPAQYDTNTKDCYPVWFKPTGAPLGVGVFNKYLVQWVEDRDGSNGGAGTGSPAVRTTYDYLGDPGWHFAQDPVTNDNTSQSWSDWRGYGQVRVRTGGGSTVESVTEYTYFRGLYGDPLVPCTTYPCAPGTFRTTQVTTSQGVSVNDENWLAGRIREIRRLDSVGGAEKFGEVHTHGHVSSTGTWTDTNGLIRPAKRVERTSLAKRVASTITGTKFTEEQWTYDALSRVVDTLTLGDTATANDDRCSRTLYGAASTAFFLGLPIRTKFGPFCDSTDNGDQLIFYDGSLSHGAAPTFGQPTLVREHFQLTPVVGYYDTVTQYNDPYKRPTSVTDRRGKTTTMTYLSVAGADSAAPGWPARIDVTDPKSYVTKTVLDAAWGEPLTIEDPNGRVTTINYDVWGRRTKVFRPDDSVAQNLPSLWFEYAVFGTGDPNYIFSWQLLDGTTTASARWLLTHTIVDGQGRTRETVTRSPDLTKRIVATTLYDNQGRAARFSEPFPVTGAMAVAPPGSNMLVATLATYPTVPTIPKETENTYDAYGRVLTSATKTNGVLFNNSATVYDGWFTKAIPPLDGGQPTSTLVDGFGRPVEMNEYKTSTEVAATTYYSYASNGQLASITDSAGNLTSMSYDQMGRRTKLVDPDQGTSISTFDGAGNVLTSIDNAGTTLTNAYDDLGRKCWIASGTPPATCAGALPANVRSSWVYDTNPVGNVVDAIGWRGLLTSATRHAAGGQYVETVNSYDQRDRVLSRTTTIPNSGTVASGGNANLAGSYTYNYTYDKADHRTTIGYPGITYPGSGSLPAETVTTNYDSLGNTSTLTTNYAGITNYVTASTYDAFGRLTGRTMNTAAAGLNPLVRTYGYDSIQRLNVMSATAGATTVQNDTYTFNGANNVTKVADTTAGNQSQCFKYDHRVRLVDAWTMNGTAACAGVRPTAVAPVDGYSHNYSYSEIGNLLSLTRGTTATTYTYPGSGSGNRPANTPGPHAVVGTNPSTNNAEYTPITPVRLLDTRAAGPRTGQCATTQTGATATATCVAIASGAELYVQVGGQGGVPAAASAVSVNLTAVAPTGPGFLTVYPADIANPGTSNVNYVAGQTIANGALVKLSTAATAGRIKIRNGGTAPVEVLMDVTGYHNNTAGATFNPISARALDTRAATRSGQCPTTTAQCTAIPAAGIRSVQVAGRYGVPAGATAVAVNVTAVAPAAAGFMTLFPGDLAGAPATSNLQYQSGQIIAGFAIVKLPTTGPDAGRLKIFANTATEAILDIQGWYTSTTENTGGVYTPLNPSRILKTSAPIAGTCYNAAGAVATCAQIPAGGTITVQIGGLGSIPADASAAALNITASSATSGVVSVYPTGNPPPTTSTVNTIGGRDVANTTITALGQNGRVTISANTATHIIIDTEGHYSAPTNRATSYQYDANGALCWKATGNLTNACASPPAGSTQYTWTPQQQLASVITPTGTTAMVYDTAGQRIRRQNPSGTNTITTIYLEGIDLTQTTTSGGVNTIVATRYYNIGGANIASRRNVGTATTLTWLLGDRQGTASITITAGTTTATRQRYTPYGEHRGTGSSTPTDNLNGVTDHGYLNQTEDDTTGLTYLNARYYDPTIGRFISVDPLTAPANPQTLNHYTYAGNDPVGRSDPSGLCYGAADAGSLGIVVDVELSCIETSHNDLVWDSLNDAIGGLDVSDFSEEYEKYEELDIRESERAFWYWVYDPDAPHKKDNDYMENMTSCNYGFDSGCGVAMASLKRGSSIHTAMRTYQNGIGAGSSAVALSQGFGSALGVLDSESWNAWMAPPWDRGVELERRVRGNNLGKFYKTFDLYSAGVATSIKSRDIDAKRYNGADEGYYNQLKKDIDNAAAGTVGDRIVNRRELIVLMKPGSVATPTQAAQFNWAVNYGREKGVTVISMYAA